MKVKMVPSICSYCGTGCGILFQVINDRLVDTFPLKSHPVSHGKLCIKGWKQHEYILSPKRLTSPMVRKDGELVSVTWDEAIGAAADKLKPIVEKYGPDSVGVLVSARATNEENYLAQKFARAVIGTNNVDHCARL